MPGDDQVCITQVQYDNLMSLTTEARDKSASVEAALCDDVLPAIEHLDESIRGNGKIGLNVRMALIERTVGIENEHTRELSKAKLNLIGQKVEEVSKSSVDWKWVAVLAVGLLQAIGLYLVAKG